MKPEVKDAVNMEDLEWNKGIKAYPLKVNKLFLRKTNRLYRRKTNKLYLHDH